MNVFKHTARNTDGQSTSLRTKLKNLWDYLFHTKNGRLFVGALALIIGTGVSLLLYIASQATHPTAILPSFIQPPEPTYSTLTGRELDDDTPNGRPVTAVIIENNPESRPQSGLKEAGIVYEAVAEAGITRFLVLYQEDQPELIGPVRSLRPYYVEWASAYDPAVAHVGGSARALKMIRSGDYGTDIDQFFNASTYWRADDRMAPHNVYTDSSRIDQLLKDKDKTSSTFVGFARKDPKAVDEPDATRISIGVSSGNYAVSYRYNADTNTYARYQGGSEHKDREKGIITPSTVIAMKVDSSASFEDGYRESIKTTGDGEAVIFQNGTAQKVTWQRVSDSAEPVFVDSEGDVVKLNRGQTWITALDTDREITWR